MEIFLPITNLKNKVRSLVFANIFHRKKLQMLAGSGYRKITHNSFGEDYMMYTVQNQCVEIPQLEYDDGLQFIYFNTNILWCVS